MATATTRRFVHILGEAPSPNSHLYNYSSSADESYPQRFVWHADMECFEDAHAFPADYATSNNSKFSPPTRAKLFIIEENRQEDNQKMYWPCPSCVVPLYGNSPRTKVYRCIKIVNHNFDGAYKNPVEKAPGSQPEPQPEPESTSVGVVNAVNTAVDKSVFMDLVKAFTTVTTAIAIYLAAN